MTTMMTTNETVPDERWCPVAYVTMQDTATRAEIVSVLERSGWTVVPQPTGFHLIQAISGVIEGHQTWLRPSMIVIDARSRGCSGVTIAAGLRDLGITIPIVLIAAAGDALPVSSDETLRIVDAASAKSAVAELATPAREMPGQVSWPGTPDSATGDSRRLTDDCHQDDSTSWSAAYSRAQGGHHEVEDLGPDLRARGGARVARAGRSGVV
jgi:CheY-like chemotaxis protein